MFKIRIGKLYINNIIFNTYDDESEIRFTADFEDAKEFREDDYFYVDIIKNLLEIDNIDAVAILKVVDSNE